MADASTASRKDPEDRIFVFREPIVSTTTRKTADNIEVMLNIPTKGRTHLVGPLQLMPNLPIQAAEGQTSGRRLQGGAAPNSANGCQPINADLFKGFVFKPFGPGIGFSMPLHPGFTIGVSINALATFSVRLEGEVCIDDSGLTLMLPWPHPTADD